MATDSPTTRALLAKAEARHVAEMAGVSPHGHLEHLTTPVYLLHGQGDNIIPAAETLWMESELPTTTLKAALISPILSHLDLDGAGPGVVDNLRRVHFLALVLREAATAAPTPTCPPLHSAKEGQQAPWNSRPNQTYA